MEPRDEARRIMEMQMDALKEEHGVDVNAANRIPKNARSANNAKLAALYEDAAEYEAELKAFESEFEILNDNALIDLVEKLNEYNPEYDGNYATEVSEVIVNGFTHLVTVEKTHTPEQLERVKNTDISEYIGDFEEEIRAILVKRWKFLIDIKKEHIADERGEMKLMGMKPDHIRKVYYNYHGLPQD